MKKTKIKGSAQKMSPLVPICMAFGYAAVLLVIRILQMTGNTNFETGFFLEKDAGVYLFYILAVAGVPAVCALCFLCGKLPDGQPAAVRRPVSALASVMLATAFGVQAINGFSVLSEDAKAAGLSLYDACTVNGTFRDLVLYSLGAVSMIAFVLYAAACLTANYKWLRYPAVLFLAAPLWGALRVISCFSYTVSYLVAAELFCDLYAAVFLMLFLFCMARFITDTTVPGGMWTLFASGLCSAVFCLLASVPRMCTDLMGLGTVEGFGTEPIFVAGAVFSVVSVLSACRKGMIVKAEEEKAENNETEEDGDIPVSPFTVE